MSVAQSDQRTAVQPAGTLASIGWRIAVGAALVLIVWALADVILIIFFAILLAVVIRGAADWLASRLRLSPRLMLGAVSIGIFIAAAALIYWIGPRLLAQMQDLLTRLTEQFEAFRRHFDHTAIGQHMTGQLSSVGRSTSLERPRPRWTSASIPWPIWWWLW